MTFVLQAGQDVSWVGTTGRRCFGTFVRWHPRDPDFAICRSKIGGMQARIYKGNLCVEMG